MKAVEFICWNVVLPQTTNFLYAIKIIFYLCVTVSILLSRVHTHMYFKEVYNSHIYIYIYHCVYAIMWIVSASNQLLKRRPKGYIKVSRKSKLQWNWFLIQHIGLCWSIASNMQYLPFMYCIVSIVSRAPATGFQVGWPR